MEGPVHEWAGQALERLTAHGYRPVTPLLGDTGEVAVARRADFRAKWGLTKLHTCVLVREVDVATAEHVLSEGAIGGLVVPCASNPLLMRFGTRAAFRGDCRLRWPFCPSSCVGVRRRGRWSWRRVDFLGEQQRLVAEELDGRVLPPGGERRANRFVLIGGAVGGVGAAVLLVALLVAHLAGAI